MKKLKYIIGIVIGASMFWACTEDSPEEVKPSDISNIASFEGAGKIGITWDYEEPKNIEYIKFSFFNKRTGEENVRLASGYADTIIIPGTLKRLGEYEFKIQPFSYTHTGGNIHTFSATSGAAPKVTTIESVDVLTLTPEQLYTDAQEPKEGPLKDLVDGNNETYFHARWSGTLTPFPHYIVVDLGKKVKGFSFSYVTRNHSGANNKPKKMDIYVSNTFDSSTFDVSQAKEVAQLEGLPNVAAQTYTSGNYIVDDGDGYRYIWFQVKEAHGPKPFFAMAELQISELGLKIVNPEAEPVSSEE